MNFTRSYLLIVVQIFLSVDFAPAKTLNFELTSEDSFVTVNGTRIYGKESAFAKPRRPSLEFIRYGNNPFLRRTLFRFKNIDTSRSTRKCAEYAKTLERIERHAQRGPRSVGYPNRLVEYAWNDSTSITGERTARAAFTHHVVALGRHNKDKRFSFHCGGSLIDPSWILTAAHCTHGVSGGLKIARLGIQRLSDNDGQTVLIKRTIRHPSYRPPAMYADIALLELERPVTIGTTIKPACVNLPAGYDKPELWVLGWGASEFGGNESNSLQEAPLDFVSHSKCAEIYNGTISAPRGVTPSMICAGAPRDSLLQDTCQGDSGGPLQTVHPTWPCLDRIIGITSFGTVCGLDDSPGVYTNVTHYLDWIEDIAWPEDS